MAKYIEGSSFRSFVEIRDPQTKALFDPEQVEFRLKNPAGAVTAIEPVRTGTGCYEVRGVLNMAGSWFRQWKISGSAVGVDESVIIVRASQFTTQ